MSHGYGKESHAINEGIKGGDAGKLKVIKMCESMLRAYTRMLD